MRRVGACKTPLEPIETAMRCTSHSALRVIWLALLLSGLAWSRIASANDAENSSGNPDAELNTAYKQLLEARKGDDPFLNFLRDAQRAWVNYRDQRASLQAAITGATVPDKTTIQELTLQRVEELRHIAKDGLPADLRSEPDQRVFLAQMKWGYRQFRQEIVDRRPGGIIVAWITFQQAWNDYSDKESALEAQANPGIAGVGAGSDFPKATVQTKAQNRLDQMHWADLTLLAKDLGLQPAGPPDPSVITYGNPFDQDTVISPQKDFRVETLYNDSDTAQSVVISSADKSQQTLADPKAMANGSTGDKRDDYSSQVYISPDSRWIFQVAMRSAHRDYLGNAYLYKVAGAAPITLQRTYSGQSFAQAALSALGKQLKLANPSLNSIDLVQWKPGKLVFSISASYGNNTGAWQCEFDLAKGKFSKPVQSSTL